MYLETNYLYLKTFLFKSPCLCSKEYFEYFRDSPARKTDVLRLDMSGRFAINIIDNLVVVHHQASRVRHAVTHGKRV